MRRFARSLSLAIRLVAAGLMVRLAAELLVRGPMAFALSDAFTIAAFGALAVLMEAVERRTGRPWLARVVPASLCGAGIALPVLIVSRLDDGAGRFGGEPWFGRVRFGALVVVALALIPLLAAVVGVWRRRTQWSGWVFAAGGLCMAISGVGRFRLAMHSTLFPAFSGTPSIVALAWTPTCLTAAIVGLMAAALPERAHAGWRLTKSVQTWFLSGRILFCCRSGPNR